MKSYHLDVSCEGEEIIYNRKLKEGPGDTLYGIEVAAAMKLDVDVIKMAMDIRRGEIKESADLITPKASKYNKNVYMNNCKICGITCEEVAPSTLDVHHICQQKDADCHNIIVGKDFHKNNKHNLVVLCKSCHTSIHQGKIILKGWVFTTGGVRLDYVEAIVKPKKGKRICEREKILSYKDSGLTLRNISKKLLEDGVKISSSSISRIWKED